MAISPSALRAARHGGISPEVIAINRGLLLPASSVATHEAAGDPHTQYQTAAEGATTAASAVATHETNFHAAPGAPATETLSGSPHTYTNATSRPALAAVSGGTATAIELSHNGSAWVGVGVITGAIVVPRGHRLRITYTVAPTVTIFGV